MTLRKTIATLALAVSASGMAWAQGVDMEAAPQELPVGTCINMGNSLEPPQEGSWGGKNITPEDFAQIKAAGFDTVRIPVRWHNKSLSEPPYTIDPDWLDRVSQVVDWALAAELNVMLNSHHFDPIHADPLGTATWHGGVWQQISERFAGYPEDSLWFELENEPHNNFTNANLLETLAPALAAVRAHHPTRPVIYGGENWSGVDSLATLPLPDDANVYPTFHYYDPFPFTHQGASWTAPNIPPPGRKFGSTADMQQLAKDVEKVRSYIARTGKVPIMGETGAYDLHIATPERAAFHSAVNEAFAPTGISMCAWAYANTFPFFDHESGSWLPGMRAAMGLEEAGYVAPAPAPASTTAGNSALEPKNRRLPAELEAFDAQLPGWLVNDAASLEWYSFGDSLKRKTVVDPSIPGGGGAVRFTIRRAGEPWSAGVTIPLLADIEEGREMTLGFWARAISSDAEDDLVQLNARFQQDATPYPGFGDTALSVGSNWQFYEVSAIADRDVNRASAAVSLQLGAQKQVVEIGQAIVVVGASSITGAS